MFRKALIKKNKKRDATIRWRLHEPARIEAFSDAVMAFALTLIVVSLEVPKTFEALLINMRGFFGFAICFTLLVLIWHDQYLFFRRFGLQDTRTIFYNLVLLFVVLFFVYPLKFLFSFLTEGNNFVTESGPIIKKFTEVEQVSQLMLIYGSGYLVIYLMMLLMYAHALGKSHELKLSPLEIYNTRTQVISYYGRLGVVIFSLSIAYFGMHVSDSTAFFSGISYILMWPVSQIIFSRRNKKILAIFSEQEINEVRDGIVLVKEKT